MIEVVTFDLDNTLWETDTVIRRAEAAMRDWLIERVPEAAEHFAGEALWRLREAVARQRPDIRHDVTRLRKEILRRALIGCGMTEADAIEHANAAFEVFAHARHQVTYYDGALETLRVLKTRYQLGALTNGNADFERLGLDRYFSFGFTAADVGASKPHPAMFEAALRRTGVSARAAAHVGDHPIDDIEGARAVGMRAIWVNYDGREAAMDAHATITALPQLPDVLRRLA